MVHSSNTYRVSTCLPRQREREREREREFWLKATRRNIWLQRPRFAKAKSRPDRGPLPLARVAHQ